MDLWMHKFKPRENKILVLSSRTYCIKDRQGENIEQILIEKYSRTKIGHSHQLQKMGKTKMISLQNQLRKTIPQQQKEKKNRKAFKGFLEIIAKQY